MNAIQSPVQTWYVVHTNAHAEKMAKAHLEQAGYEVFFPHYLTVARKRNKHRETMTVMKPYFPRYLFLADPLRCGLYGVNNAPGVATVLGDRNTTYEVPARDLALIDRLRDKCDEDGCVGAPRQLQKVERPPQIPKGAYVHVVEGPLKGAPGTVEYDDGKSLHARVSINLFDRPMLANIAVTDLIIIAAGTSAA